MIGHFLHPRLLHGLVRASCAAEAHRFARALADPEGAQRTRLAEILRANAAAPAGRAAGLGAFRDYETFASDYPVTEYADWRERIERQRAGEATLVRKVERFEPTSGSTGERKWIPYSPEFLGEMNRAAKAWLADLYATYPGLARGPHFWSLYWVPSDLRATLNTNDVALFPWWQRAILKRVVAAHPALPHAETSAAAWWATKVLLASAADLTFISAWSPTYAAALFREIHAERAELAEALRTKRWVRHETELARFAVPGRADFPVAEKNFAEFLKRAWPKLALVSAWDAAASRPFAEELRALTNPVPLQGKGLWATEGVVSIPWRGQYPLAIRSHFYEFRRLAGGEILPAWKLSLGDEVQPILTTSSGLLRYALADRLRVSGFVGKTPSVEFLGRLGGVDLVGEKLGFVKAEETLAAIRKRFPEIEAVCLGAGREGSQARYSLLGVGAKDREAEVGKLLEAELGTVHHYALARELHQMLPAGAKLFATLAELEPYLERNPVKGQNKPSPIVVLPPVPVLG